MVRFAQSLLLVALISAAAGLSQESSSSVGPKVAGVSPDASDSNAQQISPQVADAEAAISGSDWKAAEAKLNAWLAGHPQDSRALFDLGYVADAQNRADDAANFYRRAIAADPKSFESHL